MKNLAAKIYHDYYKYGLKNLYGGNEFFDKEATICEFFSLFPEVVCEHYETYDELYEHALSVVGKMSFEEKTKNYDDYFYLMKKQDKMVALLIGILGYISAKETDRKGKDIEKSIDVFFQNVFENPDFDINNAFDIKAGAGHRMFGHDPAAFAFKNIPSNYLIYVKNEAVPNTRKIIRVGEFLSLDDGVEFVSMWDIIRKFYWTEDTVAKNIWNCMAHVAVHFLKDLFTPDGLPLPFTSLLETYKYEKRENLDASVLSYRDSFYQKSRDAHLKASDFTSLAVVKALSSMYVKFSGVGKEIQSGYEDDMNLLAMSTCITFQISSLVLSQENHAGKKGPVPIIDGAKFNVPLITAYMNVVRKEIFSVFRANKRLKIMCQEMKDGKE